MILDDATSEIYYAQLVEEESTRTVMAGLWVVIDTKGVFCSLYSDRGSHFFLTRKEGEKVDKDRLTQVGRAMKELGVNMIAAYSPQARGRSERSCGPWQGRLPQELRLAGISSVGGANRFLREQYIAEFNRKFSVPAAEKGTAFRRTGRSDLNWIFSVQTERMVNKDNTVAIRERLWQIDKSRFRHSLAGTTVTIHEHLDETVSIRFGPHVVGRFDSKGERLPSTEKRGGKGGSVEAGENQQQVSSGSPTPLEISQNTRDSHFPAAPTTRLCSPRKRPKQKQRPNPKPRRRPKRPHALPNKADRSRVNKSGQLDLLTTIQISVRQRELTRWLEAGRLPKATNAMEFAETGNRDKLVETRVSFSRDTPSQDAAEKAWVPFQQDRAVAQPG